MNNKELFGRRLRLKGRTIPDYEDIDYCFLGFNGKTISVIPWATRGVGETERYMFKEEDNSLSLTIDILEDNDIPPAHKLFGKKVTVRNDIKACSYLKQELCCLSISPDSIEFIEWEEKGTLNSEVFGINRKDLILKENK